MTPRQRPLGVLPFRSPLFGSDPTTPPPSTPPAGNPPPAAPKVRREDVEAFLTNMFDNANSTRNAGTVIIRTLMSNLMSDKSDRYTMGSQPLDGRLQEILKTKMGYRDAAKNAAIIEGFHLVMAYLNQMADFKPKQAQNAGEKATDMSDPYADWQAILDNKERLEYIQLPLNFRKAKPEDVLKYHAFREEDQFKINERIDASGKKEGSDAQKARGWLNTVLHFPWKAETKDQIDTDWAKKHLDSNFYGMETLKERIIEDLISRKLQGGNKGGIILLVGPPGTGKTAVAKAIAECMGRKFVRRSLAGVNDPVKILGHDYTYVGSKRGAIVDGMIEAGTLNPVFQLDEVDKVGRDSNRGNPLDALLGVLDPQQNHQFEDAYLEMPVDLSKVLFILTANDISDFPAPILSRAETIEFPAYFPDEKMEIASRHLFPKQLAALNMPKEKVTLTKEGLSHLIRHYTAEGGVRKLEEQLKALIRKTAVHFNNNPQETHLTITPERIDQWLANSHEEPQVQPGRMYKGQVNGMYCATDGGGLIPVQVSIGPGNGQLKLTGSLGSVMKESAEVSWSLLMEQLENLSVKEPLKKALMENKVNIHIHYPDGAMKKEGPSAGIATYLALWSFITQTPIPDTLSMTGEIDLKGNVRKIGGILEKITGAMGRGIQTIVLPESNHKDFQDLCNRSPLFKEMVKPLALHFIEQIDQLTQLIADMQPSSPKPILATTA